MSSTIENAVSHLADAPEVLASKHALVGLDGFVDSIIRVVQKKTKSGDRTHYPSISSLAERIAAAAGKSTALELTIQTVKLGGNGPIMANALCSFDLPLTYIGAVGDVDGDGVHPVFQPMANACEVIVVAETAYTDALEFNDGKLMLQKMECLDNLSYDSIIACTGEEGLFNLFEKADAVALNHWSSIPHMTELWQRIQSDICPKLSERPRHIFFDLADPQKRDSEDIADALQTLAKFQSWYDTSLGLNEKEGEHICGVLGLNPSGDTKEELMMARATAIRNALGIHSVVVHPVEFAAAATAETTKVVQGPYVAEPLISTGAGDHFNSGYFLGQILGAPLEVRLQMGVGTSGYYVRTAKSPSTKDLADFLTSIA